MINIKRVLVISSANMDFVMKVEAVPEAGQSVVETRGFSYVPGGKGANSALTFVKLGAECIFCARLGADNHGNRLKALYDDSGIDTRYMVTDRREHTGLASILVEDDGQNRIIVYPGANMKLSEGDVEKAMLCYPDAVYIQFEIPDEAVCAAARFAAARDIPLFIDAGPARKDFPLERIGKCEIFSPNETETNTLTGILPNNPENCLRAAHAIMQRVECKYVVIKLGKRGAFIYDGRYQHHITAYDSDVVDTTAAGDAFTAALTLEYLKTGDIKHSVKYANAVGAIVVSRPGASTSLPTAAEVADFVAQNGITL